MTKFKEQHVSRCGLNCFFFFWRGDKEKKSYIGVFMVALICW